MADKIFVLEDISEDDEILILKGMERICPECGCKNPSVHIGHNCLKCHKPLPTGLCKRCNEWKPRSEFYPTINDCKTCRSNQKKEYYANNPDKYEEKKRRDAHTHKHQYDKPFNEFLSNLAALGEISPLTDAEWYEICNFFKGCATCGDNIEKRNFFVLPQNGGKYNRFNVFPVCEACGAVARETINPFDYFIAKLYYTSPNDKINYDMCTKLVDYFSNKVKEAANNARKDQGV